MKQPKTASLDQIRQMLASGEVVHLQRRYVPAVLDGLAATTRGTEQYLVKPAPDGMSEIRLERRA